ncbi:heavy-metal-associated domain-containing protein [Occultella glacieicola]|uniref:Heavy-metal-associated domain-containing protein n=1 Tax=Occultella glacieicola TaxID=2518684 RepID=A0ABY2E9I4_9MICO|nr:heavy metal-associated domain-containing protein [Occultella glacieicola]TDE98933.1 heavy-metal-associated domain-containing protein [Occultella glacieicola]
MDRTTTIDVAGMTCANCVAHVTEELERVDGVLDVTVELRTGEPSPVTVVSNVDLNEAAIRAAVDEAGYDVVAIHD